MTFKELTHIINTLPDSTWNRFLSPILGGYDDSKDHDITSFVFYWREVFHFLGGFIVGVLCSFMFASLPSMVAAVIPSLGVAIVIGLKEFLGDASEQANGWNFKNIVDTFAWTLGTAAVSLVTYKGSL